MAFIESPTFPQTLAFGGTGGPVFRTSVVATRGGQEQRNQHWYRALGAWDVGLVNRSLVESQALLAFFNGVALGRTNSFRFRDFLPGESTVVHGFLGLGTGDEGTYQLKKWYTSGAQSYSRIIIKPVDAAVMPVDIPATLYVDDEPTDAFTLDYTTGILTTDAPFGACLHVDFTYDVPVRFDVDTITMARVDPNRYSWPSIPLREVRLFDVPEIGDGELEDCDIEHWSYTAPSDGDLVLAFAETWS